MPLLSMNLRKAIVVIEDDVHRDGERWYLVTAIVLGDVADSDVLQKVFVVVNLPDSVLERFR